MLCILCSATGGDQQDRADKALDTQAAQDQVCIWQRGALWVLTDEWGLPKHRQQLMSLSVAT